VATDKIARVALITQKDHPGLLMIGMKVENAVHMEIVRMEIKTASPETEADIPITGVVETILETEVEETIPETEAEAEAIPITEVDIRAEETTVHHTATVTTELEVAMTVVRLEIATTEVELAEVTVLLSTA
jgi:hypothetical protein